MKKESWYKELRQASPGNRFWTRGTKTNVSIALIVVSILLSAGLLQATRTITDSSDTIETMIRCSNGNSYTATGANLQTAIWSLSNTSGTVYLPAGTITITQTTYLGTGTALQGAGMYQTEIKSTVAVGANGHLRAISGKNNISIKDLTIDGNKDVTSSGNGIVFNGVTNFLIQNVRLENVHSNGLAIMGTGSNDWNYNGFVDNVYVFNTGTAGYEAFAFNNVSDSQFSNLHADRSTAQYTMDFHGLRNCTVNNVYTQRGGTIKIYGEGSYYGSNCTFNNIVVKNTTATAGYNIWVYKYKHCSFSNLQLEDGYNGLYIQSCSYLKFDNAEIMTPTAYGFSIYDSDHIQADKIQVFKATSRGLRFDNSNNISISKISIYSSSYSLIDTCTDFTISESAFMNGVSGGLYVDESKYFTIDTTTFRGNTGGGFVTAGYTASSNYSIVNCKFISQGTGSAGLGANIGADHNITINGCLFSGNTGDGIECDAVDSVIIRECNMWGDPFDDNIVGSHKLVDAADNIGMTTI